jgi:hypothetical protein
MCEGLLFETFSLSERGKLGTIAKHGIRSPWHQQARILLQDEATLLRQRDDSNTTGSPALTPRTPGIVVNNAGARAG